ncbi:hypothetical protein [Microbacterium maritypicum]|uniref:hypothetical protein n=1 Tax=Microbacterium maritypicum TaxID=33918 RepID=UPI0022E66C41|nr:hypothetical protein [Microbacterium liquefaciens]
MAEREAKPVYVLGAGFSRAISASMPLTDELGDAVQATLGLRWPSGHTHMSFEEKLTLLSTSLPFLEGHRNTQRRAQAEQITATLADELEVRGSAAASDAAPTWLLQLISLWNAEQATVLTFNYDTLVEQAVTTIRPAVLGSDSSGESSASTVHGSQVVYPAPPAVGIRTFRDQDGPSGESFQLLKLHGSLKWFWSLGDGSTVVRQPYIQGFGEVADAVGAELAGVRTLDRFLIPPVLSKDSYYNVNLVHMLWRSAYDAVRSASRLAILGYSMPAGDRIAAELLREAPEGTPVDIVNRSIGDSADPMSPAGRAASLQFSVDREYQGEDALGEYVRACVSARAGSLMNRPELADRPDASVVVAVRLPGTERGPHSFVIRTIDDQNVGHAFDRSAPGREDKSPNDLGYRTLPFGTAQIEEFMTGASLESQLARGGRVLVNIENREYVGIDVESATIGGWPVINLTIAPA